MSRATCCFAAAGTTLWRSPVSKRGQQFRETTPRILVAQRCDAGIELRQGLIPVIALLVCRQRQVAGDRDMARMEGIRALEQLRGFGEVLRRVGLCRARHQRLDLGVRGFRHVLQAFFGVLREQDVLRGQVLLSGLEEMTLFFEGSADAGQPLRLRLLGLPLLLVGGDERVGRDENRDQNGDLTGEAADGMAHAAYRGPFTYE